MRKSVWLLLCVALAVCFASGMALAQHHGDKAAKSESLRVSGKVVSTDDKATPATVTIATLKDGKEVEMTFAITDATKFTPEAKTIADLKKGVTLQVTYKPVEGGPATALAIRLAPEMPKHNSK